MLAIEAILLLLNLFLAYKDFLFNYENTLDLNAGVKSRNLEHYIICWIPKWRALLTTLKGEKQLNHLLREE